MSNYDVIYEVVLTEQGGLEVWQHRGEAKTMIDNPVARLKAIEFALRVPTNEAGSRVLTSGQTAVVRSILAAEEFRRSEETQDAWNQAARGAGLGAGDALSTTRGSRSGFGMMGVTDSSAAQHSSTNVIPLHRERSNVIRFPERT